MTYKNHNDKHKRFLKYLNDEKDRFAREYSNMYEDSQGKLRYVNEDIFNEINKIMKKYYEIMVVVNNVD